MPRLCMASAVYRILNFLWRRCKPMGVMKDIDHADIFVLGEITWRNCNPVLFSRMLEAKATRGAQIHRFCTETTRLDTASDRSNFI